jgi:serine/threonine protein kinase/Tfp pilus assembly protein PilF
LSIVPENDPDDITRTHVQIAHGSIIGHYRIIEKIGAGGMGEVYLAEDTKLDRKVALKFLPPHLCQDADCRARFKREAQAAAKLDHPNVVSVFEVSEFQGRPFFAMQHVEGQTLKEVLSGKSLPLDRILEIGIQVCEGLQAAHETGITHRDIKPSNILIDSHGRARIVDFGLASVLGMDHVTKTGSTLGTIGYMSPEQVRGEEADNRSDLFSLGVVLYELITGHAPFMAGSEVAMLKNVVDMEPEPLARYRTDVPDELHRIVNKTLAKDKYLRYQHTDDLLADLKTVYQQPTLQVLTKKASIVVLPFSNLSPDTEQEYFCDGMAEEIINALSHIGDLQVVARTTAFSFKGQATDVREIGGKLGVKTVLEGSVRRFENRLRITTQLVDVASGYHLWSEKFDRELEDIFAIQDEISLAVVESLKIQLGIGGRAKLMKRYTDNPVAYSLYLKGRYFWNRRHQGSMQQAIACFQEAIEKDPIYAPAHIGLADSYGQMAVWGLARPRDAFDMGKAALAKGLQIDDTLAEAYVCDGWIKMFYDWDAQAAETAFLRALELDPNSAHAHRWYGILLLSLGRGQECHREIARSLEIDPVLLMTNAILGLAFYWSRDFEKSEAQLKRTMELESDFAPAYLFRGQNYAGMQMWDEAVGALITYNKMTLNSPIGVGRLALIYGLAGRRAEARATLNQLHELSRQKYVSPLYFALAHAGLDERDRAFEYLDRAILEREPWMFTIKDAPFLDCLRSDPRFATLLNRIIPSQ